VVSGSNYLTLSSFPVILLVSLTLYMDTTSANKKSLAFTMMEVLGATAVLATLATVSIVSIKGTVQAGQRSAVQRELQTLNTALQNFKSAGGVLSNDLNALDAVLELQKGTELAGGDFMPLASDPPEMNLFVAGEPFELQYDPEAGFTYLGENGERIGQNGMLASAGAAGGGGGSDEGSGGSGGGSDSGSGGGSDSGSGGTPPTTGGGFPEFYTPENIAQSLERLIAMTPGTGNYILVPGMPEYDALISELALAMNMDLPQDTVNAIIYAMQAEGLVYNPLTLSFEPAVGANGVTLFGAREMMRSYRHQPDVNAVGEPGKNWWFFSPITDTETEAGVALIPRSMASLYMAVPKVPTDAGPAQFINEFRRSLAWGGDITGDLGQSANPEMFRQFLAHLPAGEAGKALNYLTPGTFEETNPSDVSELPDLSGLNLTNWDPRIQRAVLGYNLNNTNLSGVNFSGVQFGNTFGWTSYVSMAGARISASTIPPSGTANLDSSGTGTWAGRTVINWIIQ
jgi:type II secretory pathway pseudopilin PulG